MNLPQDTPCGSVPDAYWVLNDGTAYGTIVRLDGARPAS